MKPVFSAAVLLAVSVFAFAEPSTIIKVGDTAAIEAAKDTEATVEGKIAKAEWSRSGKVCNIEFEGEPKFMAVVFEKSRPKLDEAFGGDFSKDWTGAVVRLTGKIAPFGGKVKKYEGYSQMILSQMGQISVLTPATQPSTQPATMPAAQ